MATQREDNINFNLEDTVIIEGNTDKENFRKKLRRSIEKDAEGVHLLRLASNQNHSAAQFEFARCYMSGLIVDRDTDEAIKWFVKSAQSGYVDAQLILGRVYSSGEDVEQDYEQSFYWYDMARKAGDANSIYEPRRSVGRHQPKMSESPTIYVHITRFA